MKKVLLASILIISSVSIYAQTWKWAEANTGGAGNMNGMGIGVSPTTGNIFINARCSGTITLGGGTSATGSGTWAGSSEVNNVGHGGWSIIHPGAGWDYCYGFGFDNHDNSYTTGIYNSGSNGFFVDKTNASGTILWTNAVTTSGPSGYGNIAIDVLGYVYVTGNFSGNINFGSGHTVNAGAGGSIFLAKYAPSDGHCIWVKNYGSNGGNDGGRGVYIDPASKHLYIVGYYSGSATFSGITTPAAGALTSLFVTRLDTAGTALWVSTATNAGFCTGASYWSYNGLTVDSSSNVYVTGHFQNTAAFANASGSAFTSMTSAGSDDIYVGKCLSTGNWEWVQRAGGTGSDQGWALALGKHGDVYLTGYYAGTANFSGTSVSTSAPNNALFVAKYNNSSGALQWVLTPTATSTGNSNGTGITVDDTGFVYVTGSTATVKYGSTTVSSGTVLVAKIDTASPLYIVPTVNTNYCTNVSTSLPYSVVGTFNAGNKFIAELSDANGSFADPLRLDSVTSTTSGNINITIPTGTTPGSTYLIRVISTNPATSSWANGSGAYYSSSSYPNDFYVTIGGALPVTVTPAAPVICSGSSDTIRVVGGSSAYTYTWTGSATTADSLVVSPNTTTPYTVSVTGACAGTATFTVTVNSLPNVGISGGTTVCAGLSSPLTATGATSYVWSDGSTNNTFTAAPASTGTKYYVTGTTSGCSAADTVTMTVNPLPSMLVTPSNPEICAGGSISLLASGAGVTGSYSWAPDSGIATPSAASTNSSPGHTTTYTVVGMDLNGCQNSTTVTLTVNPNPTVTVTSNLSVCAGGSANLTATGGTSYTWTPDTALSSNTVASPVANPTTTTVYKVTASNGSCSASGNVTVTVNPDPVNTVSGGTTITIGQGGAQLNTNNTSAGVTYSWMPATGLSCTTCANPTATPSVTTNYTLTVTDNSGCNKEDSALVIVKQSCGPIYMPNAFSPNGDGNNDQLKVYGNCIKGIDLVIFDRWGNIVYQSTDPAGVWDGTSKGKILNTGTYVYTLVVTDQDNNTVNKKGNITLLR